MNWIVSLATCGRIGYLLAPGTCATVCTLPLVLLIKYSMQSAVFECALLTVVTLIALIVVHRAKDFFRQKDPQVIVLDEVVGCLWAFWLVPVSLTTFFWGVLLFRFFDMSKTFGIRYIEKLPGAFGIVMDDIAAGLYTTLLLYLIS